MSSLRGSASGGPCRLEDMRLFRIVLPLLIALAIVLAFVPVAAANTYVVYSCKTRIGTPAPIDGFTASQNVGGSSTFNECAAGGSFGASLAANVDQPRGAVASWRFNAPANTEIRQFDVWRSVSHITSTGDTSQKELIQWTGFPGPDYVADRREWCGSSFCASRGFSTDALDARNLWYSGTLSGVRDAFFSVGCFGWEYCGARASSGSMAAVRIQGVQWILTDDHNPVAQAPAGSLIGPGPHRGIEAANFDATDMGSGLYWSMVEIKAPTENEWTTVKRRIVDANGGRCAELDGFANYPYEFGYTVPCRLSSSIELPWDTAEVADGDYEMRIRLEDASGNSTNVAPSRPFKIDNVPPPAATTPPSVAGTARLGQELQGDIGAWSGAGNTYVWRWLRCTSEELPSCTPIAGASDDAYRPVADDLNRRLRFEVTATNLEGSTTISSAPVGPVTNANGAVPQCADDRDNDADGKIDLADPACTTREGTNEAADTEPAGGFSNPVVTPAPGPGGSPATTPGENPASPSPNTSAGAANGINGSRGARLTSTGPRRRAIGFGRRTQTTLSLRDENGRPITGATVIVLQRMQVPGARFVPAHAPVKTDAEGKVRYSALAGYSRTLRFAYKARTDDAAYATTQDLAIGVRSKTTLRTSDSSLRNGETLRFKGRLKSRPVPRAGVVIDLQARVGTRWQSFSTVRTNARGTWKSKYTFRSTTGVQTYVFRARVRGDSGFPYLPSNSARAKVKVRG